MRLSVRTHTHMYSHEVGRKMHNNVALYIIVIVN